MTVAVTGGIGSGKSLVCSMLAARGVPVYDSDSRTKALYQSVPGLARRISVALGAEVCRPDGTLDKAALAASVFSDAGRLKVLEGIVYPEVRKDFLAWKDAVDSGCGFVVLESAVILEKPIFRDIIDKVLLVDAPEQLRLERAMERDGAGADAVRRRMSRQGIFGGRCLPQADFLIVNDGDVDSLEAKVDDFYGRLMASIRQYGSPGWPR